MTIANTKTMRKTMTMRNTNTKTITKTMTKTKFQLGPSLQQRNKDVRYVQIALDELPPDKMNWNFENELDNKNSFQLARL